MHASLWPTYSSVCTGLKRWLRRMTGKGIKTKPMGDVGGELSDWVGSVLLISPVVRTFVRAHAYSHTLDL